MGEKVGEVYGLEVCGGSEMDTDKCIIRGTTTTK
jgi:hypothetical protein